MMCNHSELLDPRTSVFTVPCNFVVIERESWAGFKYASFMPHKLNYNCTLECRKSITSSLTTRVTKNK